VARKNEGDDDVGDEDFKRLLNGKFDPSNFDHNGHVPLLDCRETMNLIYHHIIGQLLSTQS
jgi:hypothetical protein